MLSLFRLYLSLFLFVFFLPLYAGGYLFAVVDPLETLVQFGLRIGPALSPGQSELSLYHTHPEDRFMSKVRDIMNLIIKAEKEKQIDSSTVLYNGSRFWRNSWCPTLLKNGRDSPFGSWTTV
jgi:hypothetical protein